jgi:hypothetical protein
MVAGRAPEVEQPQQVHPPDREGRDFVPGAQFQAGAGPRRAVGAHAHEPGLGAGGEQALQSLQGVPPQRRLLGVPAPPRPHERPRNDPQLVNGPAQALAPTRSAASRAASVGFRPTGMFFAPSASAFACAVPEEPEMIAPAWPMRFPGGASKPAM